MVVAQRRTRAAASRLGAAHSTIAHDLKGVAIQLHVRPTDTAGSAGIRAAAEQAAARGCRYSTI
jgi:hypothetical protein